MKQHRGEKDAFTNIIDTRETVKLPKIHESSVLDGQIRENREEAIFEELEAGNSSKLADLESLGYSILEDTSRARC